MVKRANLLGAWTYLCWESPQVFDPLISSIAPFVVDSVAKLVFGSVVVDADNSPAPTL